jgi:hypothetical protein
MNVRMAKTLRTGSFLPFDHSSCGFVWSLMPGPWCLGPWCLGPWCLGPWCLGPWCFEKPGSYFACGPYGKDRQQALEATTTPRLLSCRFVLFNFEECQGTHAEVEPAESSGPVTFCGRRVQVGSFGPTVRPNQTGPDRPAKNGRSTPSRLFPPHCRACLGGRTMHRLLAG